MAISRSAMVLGLIAALEALVIVALVVRQWEPETLPANRSAVIERREPAPDSERGPSRTAAEVPLREPSANALDSGAALPSVALETAEPLSAPPSEISVGLMLVGTVAAADGTPIADLGIELRFSDRGGHVRTSHGAYAIAGLQPGTLDVTCWTQHFLRQSVSVELDRSQPITRQDFLLERAPEIPIRFRTHDGQPLLSLLEGRNTPNLKPVATPNAVGVRLPDYSVGHWKPFSEYEDLDDSELALVAQEWDGLMTVDQPLPVYVSVALGGEVLASERVERADVGVTFMISLESILSGLCTVHARVVALADRRPVPGALGQLDNTRYLPFDDMGSIEFEHVQPGKHTLLVHPPGSWLGHQGGIFMIPNAAEAAYGGTTVSFDLSAGQRLDLGEIPLERTFTVRGHVTDATGRPIAVEVTADCVDPALDPSLPQRSYRARVDDDGSFVIRLAPGRWDLRPGFDRFAAPPTIVDVSGDIEDIHLVSGGSPPVK